MTEKITAFHLSSQSEPVANSDGNYLIATPAFIFNHRKKDSLYLHQIEFEKQDIIEHIEDGHHDMASNFSIDEYFLVKKLISVKKWKLDNRNDQKDLLSSDFYKSCLATLFSPVSKINELIISVSNDDVALDYIQSSDTRKTNLWRSVPKDRIDLKIKLVKKGVFTEEQIASFYKLNSSWEELAKFDQSRIAYFANYRENTSRKDLFLIEYSKAQKNIRSKALRFNMFIQHCLGRHRFEDSLFVDERFTLPPEAIVFFLRLFGEEYVSQLVANNLGLNWRKQDLKYLIDRAVVFGALEMVDIIRSKFSNMSKEISLWTITSELATSGKSKSNCSLLKEVAALQSDKYKNSISELATEGAFYSIRDRLKTGIDETELNKAMLKASENGYTAIVKLLHHHGANLSYWDNFSIKYANKYNYIHLKSFLLEQKLPDVYFS